jgi:hypothetical protein
MCACHGVCALCMLCETSREALKSLYLVLPLESDKREDVGVHVKS